MLEGFVVSAETLSAVAGAVLSLAFSLVPKLRNWFDGLTSNARRYVMIGLLAILSSAIFAASCKGWASWVACSADGLVGLIKVALAAATANQVVHRLTPR